MDVKHLMCFRSENSVFKLLQRSVDSKHLMRIVKKKLFYFWYEAWFDMVAGRSETIYLKATSHIWIAADSIWIARLRLRKKQFTERLGPESGERCVAPARAATKETNVKFT